MHVRILILYVCMHAAKPAAFVSEGGLEVGLPRGYLKVCMHVFILICMYEGYYVFTLQARDY